MKIDCQILAFEQYNTCVYACDKVGLLRMKNRIKEATIIDEIKSNDLIPKKKSELKDYWLPVMPPIKIARTLINHRMFPQIEMKMFKDGINAEVIFPFFFQNTAAKGFIDANYKRIIKGEQFLGSELSGLRY